MRSLFEEQILNEHFRDVQDVDSAEDTFSEALTYYPRRDEYRIAGVDRYLEQVARLKQAVSIPVIASLNGVTPGGWAGFARDLEQAGADALELNFYLVTSDPVEECDAVEGRLLQVVRLIRESVRLPIAVKLSPFFSALPRLVRRLEEGGADAVVVFNRFYQPDIDIEELEVAPRLRLSDSSELLLRLRWLAMLSGRTGLALAVTGGVHSAQDAIKAVMCGAHAVQMVSALLLHGPEHLATVRQGMERWMEEHQYVSLAEMCGSMSLEHTPDPAAYERANYIRIIGGGVKYV
jgi:dihydroorotate dehydrogenase (fumarate)